MSTFRSAEVLQVGCLGGLVQSVPEELAENYSSRATQAFFGIDWMPNIKLRACFGLEQDTRKLLLAVLEWRVAVGWIQVCV
jgi:hypothetical protein